MEEVKFLGGLVAEVTAVQAELTKVLDDGLLKPEWNTNANLEGLQVTAREIRQVNILGAQLNAKVQDYLEGLLDDLDQAGEDKGMILLLDDQTIASQLTSNSTPPPTNTG